MIKFYLKNLLHVINMVSSCGSGETRGEPPLDNVEDNSAKTNVFSSSKSLKAIAVEYLIFQKLFGLCGFNRSFSYFDLE